MKLHFQDHLGREGCAGYDAIKDDLETKRAPIIALRAIGDPPPGLRPPARRGLRIFGKGVS